MPEAIAAALIGGAATGISAGAAAPKDTSLAALKYKDPERKAWAEQMMGKYPTFQEGTLGPASIALAKRMMAGGLVPGVEQAYGAGAEREYGGLLSGLSDIGAGPSSLAAARAAVMGRLGERIAGARERAVEQGLSFAPTAYGMEQAPQLAALARWEAEKNLYQTTPGAFYSTPAVKAIEKKIKPTWRQPVYGTGYGYGPGAPGYNWYGGPETWTGYGG